MPHTVQILFPFKALPFLRVHLLFDYPTSTCMSTITNRHFMMLRCIFATKGSQIKQKNRHVWARGGALFIQKPAYWYWAVLACQTGSLSENGHPRVFPLVLAFSPPERVCLYQSSPALCDPEIGSEFSLLQQGRSFNKMVKTRCSLNMWINEEKMK